MNAVTATYITPEGKSLMATFQAHPGRHPRTNLTTAQMVLEAAYGITVSANDIELSVKESFA